MSGRIFLSLAALFAVSAAHAQVVVRAPFVRVETGGPGTYVRAPFVNLFVPNAPPPVVFGPPLYGPPPVMVNPPIMVTPRLAPQPLPPGEPNDPTEPPVDPKFAPPAPNRVPNAPTLTEFAKTFKPKAGHYEVTMTNPVNRQAETVRFSLPGEPQRVSTGDNHILFVYGPRRFVRIEFDEDGPMVITR